MDKNRFDGFTRQLAKRENRRQALKTLFAGGLGTATAVALGGAAEAKKSDCCPASAPRLCGLMCTDIAHDPQNCGNCGIVCAANEQCVNGVCGGTPSGQCTTAADCPGSDTACQTRTCKKGVCGVSNTPSGKTIADQTPGDCQSNTCDGVGNIISIADNTDTPLAQGECWSGTCVDGVPYQVALPAGTACSTGTCDGSGHCSGSTSACSVASDCPGTDTDCQSRTCTNGVCGVVNTPGGTPTSSQIPGDCQSTVCDGSGGTTLVVDNTDTPVAPGECLVGTCSGGVPSSQPAAAGTTCSIGFCDGAGHCVTCLVASQCPARANATAVCNSDGTCGFVCLPGFGDCNGNPSDGCEVMIGSDPNNCGVCGKSCAGGQNCCSGVCCDRACGADGACPPAQCQSNADCPPPSNECQVSICNLEHQCEITFVPYGTPVSSQTAGDCQQNVCDGAGGITTIADAKDVPPSGPCSMGACDGTTPVQIPLSDILCPVPNGTGRCQAGFCGSLTCNPGFADCNGNPSDGCEVMIGSDPNNCGVCGKSCAPGQSCVSGVCE